MQILNYSLELVHPNMVLIIDENTGDARTVKIWELADAIRELLDAL